MRFEYLEPFKRGSMTDGQTEPN